MHDNLSCKSSSRFREIFGNCLRENRNPQRLFTLIALDRLIATLCDFSTVSSLKTFSVSDLRNARLLS